jgi:hypothetical protein
MEKLMLTPQCNEIIVNNGATEGAVDLFSYGPDGAPDLKSLGSLHVVGYRNTDSENMGYMVSLIAALGRREYYAQPGAVPREAFGRTLKKINEVVEDFFKTSGVNLSVGIFAVAGTALLVSKLDKFKMLLARDSQVIDILNNVALFQKEHVEKRQFSSIISGTLQPGDRILAYYPSKAITSRERSIKSALAKFDYSELSAKLTAMGESNTSFAASLLHVDMMQTAEPCLPSTPTALPETPPVAAKPEHTAPAQEHTPSATLAWTPRQARHPATAVHTEAEPEVPQIISTEFALGTRRSMLGKWFGRLHVVRLDTRGKAVFLAASVIIVVGISFIAKTVLFVSPEERKMSQALDTIGSDLKLAQDKIAHNDSSSARQILVRALASISSYNQHQTSVRDLSASIVKTMDGLDHAQDADISLVVQPEGTEDHPRLAVWSSASNSIWTVSGTADDKLSLAQLSNGSISGAVDITGVQPSILIPFKNGALVIDAAAKKITRLMNGGIKTFALPTPEEILSGSLYGDNLYILTDHSILKVSDLDTDKPVTKQWLTSVSDLAPTALRIHVDGNVYTLGRDGMLTTYYKGKRTGSVQTPLEPSGTWELIPGPTTDQLAVANADTKRIYIIDMSGTLLRTLKLDTQQPLVRMGAGRDGSTLFITKDNKIWKAL